MECAVHEEVPAPLSGGEVSERCRWNGEVPDLMRVPDKGRDAGYHPEEKTGSIEADEGLYENFFDCEVVL